MRDILGYAIKNNQNIQFSINIIIFVHSVTVVGMYWSSYIKYTHVFGK